MNKDLMIYIMIFGAAIFTYIPRAVPLVYLANKNIPEGLKEWMKFIPPAIFAALIIPDIVTEGGSLYLSIDNPKLVSAIIVFIVAIRKKSLGISILVGVISIYFLSYF